MRVQLLAQPKNVKTGIITLDISNGPGTHWVAYAIDPRAIVYFNSYELAPPDEFMRYIQQLKIPTFLFHTTITRNE